MLELLSPAGDLEKLRTALLFGADAVYAGFQNLSLRSAGFSFEDIETGVKLCHRAGKRFYLAINIFAFNEDLELLETALPQIEKLGVDAVIISDPGVIALVKELAPSLRIHLSTQANTLNWKSVEFWNKQGVSRIVLGREVPLTDIKEIKKRVPACELEIFVHGAMCMSYSGRCLISSVLTGRSANRGDCAQPCRWKYDIVESEPTRQCEESEAKETISIEGDERGSYVMNSKDLCLIEYLPEIMEAGIDSIKIEGRMKPAYYVALTTKCYREGIAAFVTSAPLSDRGERLRSLFDELHKVSHRPFTTGFLIKEEGSTIEAEQGGYIKPYEFVGVINDCRDGLLYIDARNRIRLGDELEIFDPVFETRVIKIEKIINQKDGKALEAAHNQYSVIVPFNAECASLGSLLRKHLLVD